MAEEPHEPPPEDDDEEYKLAPADPTPPPPPTWKERERRPGREIQPAARITKFAEFSVLDVLSKTLRVWFANFLVFNLLAAAFLAPSLGLSYAARFSEHTWLISLADWANTLFGTALAAILIVGVAWQLDGHRASVRECLDRAAECAGSIVGASILAWLAATAVIFLAVVGVIMGLLCIGCSGIFVAIPMMALWFWVELSLFVALPAVVVEEHDAFAALRRSYHLVDGLRWRLLGVLVAYVVLVIVFLVPLTYLEVAVPTLGFALGAATKILLASLDAVLVGVVYHDLRQSVDGMSTHQLAQKLGAVFD